VRPPRGLEDDDDDSDEVKDNDDEEEDDEVKDDHQAGVSAPPLPEELPPSPSPHAVSKKHASPWGHPFPVGHGASHRASASS